MNRILYVFLPPKFNGIGAAREVTYIGNIPHFRNYDGSYTPLVKRDLNNAGLIEGVNGGREYVESLMQVEANLFFGGVQGE